MDKEDLSPLYPIPEWFASTYFKTHQEIQAAESPLFLTGDQQQDTLEADSEKDSDHTQDTGQPGKFSISESWFNCLRDASAASFVKNGNVSKPTFPPCIVLRRSDEAARSFTDSIVHCLAKELGAHLVTLDLKTIDELCWDFLLQNEERVRGNALDAPEEDLAAPTDLDELNRGGASNDSPTERDESAENSTLPDLPSSLPTRTDLDALCELDTEGRGHLAMFYFGTRSQRKASEESQKRNRTAIASLLHGLRLKVEGPESLVLESSSKAYTTSPILLYLPDADAIWRLNPGQRFFTRLRDFIAIQRKHGQNILMVPSGEFDWDRLLRKLKVNATATFQVPWQSDENPEIAAPSQDEDKKAEIRDANIWGLKMALYTQLPRPSVGAFLTRSAVWEFPANTEGLNLLQTRPLGEQEVQEATRQIVGRSWQKEALDVEDIIAVLTRLSHQWKKRDEPAVTKTSEPDEETVWKTKMDSILEGCNKHEEVIFAGVVDPKKLTLGYDSVIIDKKTKQLVAQLLALSLSRNSPKSHPLLGTLQSRGAMFYGPPGTGKTQLCRAIAKESNMTMLSIDGAMVQGKYVGESEKLIKAAFTLAEKLHPCILFIDEVDSLFGQRTCGQRRYERAIVTQFLEEMDGLSSSKEAPFVIVATNRPADLDEAFIRRLPQKVLFSLPTSEQRKEIFKIFLKDEDLSDCVRLELLAADTEGFSGSDIRSLCGAAALAWSMEQSELAIASCDGEESPALRLTAEHFQSAFEMTLPSVSKQSMVDIERFEKRFTKRLPKQSNSVAMLPDATFYNPRKGER